MLVKLKLPVNFIKILRAAYLTLFLHYKIQRQTESREKLRKTLSYKKDTRKMLVKLIQEGGGVGGRCDCNAVNICLS